VSKGKKSASEGTPDVEFIDLAAANEAIQEQDAEIKTLQAALTLEQEKCAALEAEVEHLSKQAKNLHSEALALGAQLADALKPKATGSVVFDDGKPKVVAPLELPVVTIGEQQYQFIRGRMFVFGRKALATELASDESLMQRILLEFPQLLRPIE